MSFLNLVDVSDIFNFFLLGRGEGGVRADREGGFFSKSQDGGGGVSQRGWGSDGAGRVSAGNLGGRGGLNVFVRGQNVH